MLLGGGLRSPSAFLVFNGLVLVFDRKSRKIEAEKALFITIHSLNT